MIKTFAVGEKVFYYDDALELAEIQAYNTSDFSRDLVSRVKKKNDAVIALCGDEGSGKSTLAIKIARLFDPQFTVQRNVIVSPDYEGVIESILDLPPQSAVVLDEAIKVASKANFMLGLQRWLMTNFNIIRKQQKLVILCIPSFFDLDAYFRKRRVLVWIQIIKRGYFIALRRYDNFMSEDRWLIKENADIIDDKVLQKKNISKISPEKFITVLRNCKNYYFDDVFEPLDDVTQKEYDDWVAKHKGNLFDDVESNTTRKWKSTVATILNYLHWEEEFNVNQMVKISGLSNRNIEELFEKFEFNLRGKKDMAIEKEIQSKLDELRAQGINDATLLQQAEMIFRKAVEDKKVTSVRKYDPMKEQYDKLRKSIDEGEAKTKPIQIDFGV